MNSYCSSVKTILSFLKDLRANNDRTWFQSNKARYDEAKKLFDELSTELISQISSFDESVKYLTPKDCTYRIYRDVRFSYDKSPYKQHMGCYINPLGRNSLHGGYYFHLEPNNCMIAVGCWRLPTNILKVVRQTIVDNTDEFEAIVEDPAFKQLYSGITFDPLKVMPRDCPKDYPHPEYLKCRNYCVEHPLTDAWITKADRMEELTEYFKRTKPFMDFINDVVDDYI